ncbi:hypothetical protein EDD30_1203 [Couchioplanes caeruleus]|uniref:Uncharacterized protein n=2 Tax=Couchioplanes caeruleus TaxID=56438 RepID=A0A1K0GF44_9ACTN|nr:hypothetical protein BG844_02090 [Couchioplanes caeruleus subsp. caeruleus]ROP28440.1 hypothetical protein EDD30_1203 [Couchioplanes caeruleus]
MPEMAMPSGFSTMFSTRAYSSTAVSAPKPAAARRRRWRRAQAVTAKAPETIAASAPVGPASITSSTLLVTTSALTAATGRPPDQAGSVWGLWGVPPRTLGVEIA